MDSHAIDQHFLELAAVRSGDYSWTLEKMKLLDFLESGGSLNEVREFLNSRSQEGIPENVALFLQEIEENSNVIESSQEAVLFKVNSALTAKLIAHHTGTKKYCYLAGECHLAVLQKNLRAFRSAIKKLGYLLPH